MIRDFVPYRFVGLPIICDLTEGRGVYPFNRSLAEDYVIDEFGELIVAAINPLPSSDGG